MSSGASTLERVRRRVGSGKEFTPGRVSGKVGGTATVERAVMASTSTLIAPCSAPTARVAAAINDDWARVVADGVAQQTASSWPVLLQARGRGLEHALAAAGGDRTIEPDVADTNLAALVRLAAVDDVAARLVLQRIVPGLVRAARRRQHAGMQQAFDELVGTAWVLVRTYPLERRPQRVAANLCRDAEYHAFVRPSRLRSGDERPLGALRDDVGDSRGNARPGGRRPTWPLPTAAVMRSELPAAADEVSALLLDALRCGVDRARVAIVAQIHLAGRHPSAVADELKISERTVRLRRETTIRQIARLAGAA